MGEVAQQNSAARCLICTEDTKLVKKTGCCIEQFWVLQLHTLVYFWIQEAIRNRKISRSRHFLVTVCDSGFLVSEWVSESVVWSVGETQSCIQTKPRKTTYFLVSVSRSGTESPSVVGNNGHEPAKFSLDGRSELAVWSAWRGSLKNLPSKNPRAGTDWIT